MISHDERSEVWLIRDKNDVKLSYPSKDYVLKLSIQDFLNRIVDPCGRAENNYRRLGFFYNGVENIPKDVIDEFKINPGGDQFLNQINKFNKQGVVTKYNGGYFRNLFYVSAVDKIHDIVQKGIFPKKPEQGQQHLMADNRIFLLSVNPTCCKSFSNPVMHDYIRNFDENDICIYKMNKLPGYVVTYADYKDGININGDGILFTYDTIEPKYFKVIFSGTKENFFSKYKPINKK